MLTDNTIKKMKEYHNNIILHALDNLDKAVISNDSRESTFWENFYIDFYGFTEILEKKNEKPNVSKPKIIKTNMEDLPDVLRDIIEGNN